jgi:hypothetical protein
MDPFNKDHGKKKTVFEDFGAVYCEKSTVAEIMLAIVFPCGIAFQKLVALDILESLLE